MKNIYNNPSKQKLTKYNKKDISSQLQLFNVPPKNKKISNSTGRKPIFESFEDSINLSTNFKRGGSFLYRKPNENKIINDHLKNYNNHSRPVMPNYDIQLKAKSKKVITKLKQEMIISETTDSVNFREVNEQEQPAAQQIHYQLVKYHQKMKGLATIEKCNKLSN